jgi:hypothetical protein
MKKRLPSTSAWWFASVIQPWWLDKKLLTAVTMPTLSGQDRDSV